MMRLSQFLEIGLEKTRPIPHGSGGYSRRDGIDYACPIVAAAIGGGWDAHNATSNSVDPTLDAIRHLEALGVDMYKVRQVPTWQSAGTLELHSIIVNLYDCERWSHTDILGWLVREGL